jgi:hypothetical protein
MALAMKVLNKVWGLHTIEKITIEQMLENLRILEEIGPCRPEQPWMNRLDEVSFKPFIGEWRPDFLVCRNIISDFLRVRRSGRQSSS